MSEPRERSIAVRGGSCRLWEAGEGEPLGVLAGLGGTPRWTPFLARLAQRRRVLVPSLPGFPGGPSHDHLDDLADWVSATLDLIEEAGLDGARSGGVDWLGASVGGALAAEAAAFSPASVRRLVLVAPYGLFDPEEPTADVWAQRAPDLPGLLAVHPERLVEQTLPPAGVDPVEWQIVQVRAHEAAARLLWPTGDRGLAKRLHRIQAPTLLVWGDADRVIPASYAKRFADGLGGEATVRTIPGAGHRVDVDAPDALAAAVLDFLDR